MCSERLPRMQGRPGSAMPFGWPSAVPLVAALLVLAPHHVGSFKVICVGYPRTGLTSLEEALLKLGFAPYRMGHEKSAQLISDKDKYGHTKDLNRWLEVVGHEDLAPLEKLADDIVLRGYDSILDIPLDNTALALGLIRHFPNAKVILTLHDGAAGWFESFRIHMQDFNMASARFSPHREIALNGRLHALRRLHEADTKKAGLPFVPKEADAQRFITAYEAHNAEVTASVGPERLLTFQAPQEWEPLCTFLALGVPSVHYPKLHTLKREKQHLKTQQHYLFVFDMFFFGIPVMCMSVMAHHFWKSWRSKLKVADEKSTV
mmetsp:Transcript_11086/g.29543  ORF Transcript_11086/g.29543 Transcript_11086/m.29543 type:complete len:319 (+) Transcript_11086:39-995(+)